jgi:hypothetical protein
MTTDNFCFYLQNRQIQTSQTGGQWYSDTSPFSIPCTKVPLLVFIVSYLCLKWLRLKKRAFNQKEENEKKEEEE